MHETFADARTMINVLAFPFLLNISFGFYKAGTGCRSSKAMLSLWFIVIVTLFIGFLSVFEFFFIGYFGFCSE